MTASDQDAAGTGGVGVSVKVPSQDRDGTGDIVAPTSALVGATPDQNVLAPRLGNVRGPSEGPDAVAIRENVRYLRHFDGSEGPVEKQHSGDVAIEDVGVVLVEPDQQIVGSIVIRRAGGCAGLVKTFGGRPCLPVDVESVTLIVIPLFK